MKLASNVALEGLNTDNVQWNCAMDFTAFTIIYYICSCLLDICLEKKPPTFRVNVHKCDVNMHLHEAILKQRQKRKQLFRHIIGSLLLINKLGAQ